LSTAQEAAKPSDPKQPEIHLVWMGGNDCPPCVIWRREELPKLQQSSVFQSIKFSYVNKTVRSPVPPLAALPDEVKPFKDKLDVASSGRSGSPQAAVLVNGEVYDYFHGRRSAAEIEKMIVAIRAGSRYPNRYPFKRCVKISTEWGKCTVRGR
jgi:hypothetical protein